MYFLKIGGVFEREGYAYAILGGQLCFEFCLFLLGGEQEFTKAKNGADMLESGYFLWG